MVTKPLKINGGFKIGSWSIYSLYKDKRYLLSC